MVICRSHFSAQISAGSKPSHCALYNRILVGLASFSIFSAPPVSEFTPYCALPGHTALVPCVYYCLGYTKLWLRACLYSFCLNYSPKILTYVIFFCLLSIFNQVLSPFQLDLPSPPHLNTPFLALFCSSPPSTNKRLGPIFRAYCLCLH